jgi:hypothetical protein
LHVDPEPGQSVALRHTVQPQLRRADQLECRSRLEGRILYDRESPRGLRQLAKSETAPARRMAHSAGRDRDLLG